MQQARSSVALRPILEKLAELYPTHKSYAKAFRRATRDAVRSKFILKPNAKLLNRAAKKSDIGVGSPSGAFLD